MPGANSLVPKCYNSYIIVEYNDTCSSHIHWSRTALPKGSTNISLEWEDVSWTRPIYLAPFGSMPSAAPSSSSIDYLRQPPTIFLYMKSYLAEPWTTHPCAPSGASVFPSHRTYNAINYNWLPQSVILSSTPPFTAIIDVETWLWEASMCYGMLYSTKLSFPFELDK